MPLKFEIEDLAVILKEMDQWLIRTADNFIAGPYSKEQICKMIGEGKLALDDEICIANGYWVYLHEREEIHKLLGVEVPRQAKGSDDEITETQVLDDEDSTDPNFAPLPENSKSHRNSTERLEPKGAPSSGRSTGAPNIAQLTPAFKAQKFAWVIAAVVGVFAIILFRALSRH